MQDDPLRPHRHDNNIVVPGDDPTIVVSFPDGAELALQPKDFSRYPQSTIAYSYTTDHGTHGPYQLRGVALRDLISAELPPSTSFTQIEVISADGFGNRVNASELVEIENPIMLCINSDNAELSRQLGLVRLVVPSETDNALRQIKWVREIRIK